MVEDGKATTPEAKQPTEAELKAQLKTALESNDFKQVAAVSRKIDQMVTAAEKAEADAKRAALDAIKGEVGNAIAKALKPIVDSGKLDAADGIWYSNDFGEAAPTVRLSKTATKTRSSGNGGGGKVFDISTDDMLTRHGTKEYKEGITFNQAYESTQDKNARYAIRKALLKLEGLV